MSTGQNASNSRRGSLGNIMPLEGLLNLPAPPFLSLTASTAAPVRRLTGIPTILPLHSNGVYVLYLIFQSFTLICGRFLLSSMTRR